MARHEGPLLVYGSRSTDYDFGSSHPLTPRRFGPGIELLEAVGAVPGLAPEPATDDELLACHSRSYLTTVRRLSTEPDLFPEAGLGPGDTPAFPGVHEAAGAVAGGSLRAVEAIIRGDVEHAYHPGGGLHHAMPGYASGFCVYNDPALAIALARRAGLRVLYVDVDTHHGDGVQAIHLADPGVLTVSVHESGRYLFPGTGFAHELGTGEAAGTSVNVPLEPGTGEDAWLDAIRMVVPAMAAAFGPDLIVSQHGADAHAWDPLAHLRVTTTAMGEAARLVDRLAHRWAGGRWLATGGGGYDVYRVVPRAWALTWLAGAHREPPERIPQAWRDRWTPDADRWGQGPPPETFDDRPNAGLAVTDLQREAEKRSRGIANLVRAVAVPRLLRVAEECGWWSADEVGATVPDGPAEAVDGPGHPAPTIMGRMDRATLERLALAPRVAGPVDPRAGREILLAALADPDPAARPHVSVAIAGESVVGAAVSVPDPSRPGRYELVALGVAPDRRGEGLASTLLAEHVAAVPADAEWLDALVTVAERDPLEPVPGDARRHIASRLLDRTGFTTVEVPSAVGKTDPLAVAGRRRVGASIV